MRIQRWRLHEGAYASQDRVAPSPKLLAPEANGSGMGAEQSQQQTGWLWLCLPRSAPGSTDTLRCGTRRHSGSITVACPRRRVRSTVSTAGLSTTSKTPPPRPLRHLCPTRLEAPSPRTRRARRAPHRWSMSVQRPPLHAGFVAPQPRRVRSATRAGDGSATWLMFWPRRARDDFVSKPPRARVTRR